MSDLGAQPPSARLGGDVVTGEAVVLELREAKLPSRAVARVIDIVVQYIVRFGLLILQSAGSLAGTVDDAAAAALELMIVVIILVGYPVIFETLTRGKTLGKMAMGLQVVRDDGGPIRFRHALVRGLVGIFEVWLVFILAVLVSAFSSRGKRIGDYLAGTVVVRVRMPQQASPMVAMPPELASWAAALDLSRLPDDLALAARQFLARAHSLRPDVREPMGLRIAQDVGRYVSPAPPNGVHPGRYLAAVLAERRRRDAGRYPTAEAPPQPVGFVQPRPPYPSLAPPVPAKPSPPVPDAGPGFTMPS